MSVFYAQIHINFHQNVQNVKKILYELRINIQIKLFVNVRLNRVISQKGVRKQKKMCNNRMMQQKIMMILIILNAQSVSYNAKCVNCKVIIAQNAMEFLEQIHLNVNANQEHFRLINKYVKVLKLILLSNLKLYSRIII